MSSRQGAICEAEKKRIVVLGSSGSIGVQVLDVVQCHADKLEIIGLAVNTNVEVLLQQAYTFDVHNLAVGDIRLRDDACCNEMLAFSQSNGGSFGLGFEAVCALAHLEQADVIVNALVGAVGLRASYEALAAGKVLALANKESLVVGGDLLMPLAHRLDEESGFKHALMPIDSEHSAIYQCLLGEDPQRVSRLWITASGGPFRGCTRSDLTSVTPEQALAHPTWNMGAKVSVDSSTLMNKGLEIIEAHHLFGMPYDRIEVVVQPQSVIHSMVEFVDGSVKAHLGVADMRIPIQFALSYPDRWDASVASLDFHLLGGLDFSAPDLDTFPCLRLACDAGRIGGTMPAVMNAANEVAVEAFLAKCLSYLNIPACIDYVMSRHVSGAVESVDQLEQVDAWARLKAQQWVADNSC